MHSSLHPRNRHRGLYDFPALCQSCPGLTPFVLQHPKAGLTIDFSDPDAVKMLNRALLSHYYHIQTWDIPPDYLCPPIPGRADYLHYLADLIPQRGAEVRVLDIGVGANCIYPLIGHQEYGWSFVGTDVDTKAIAAATQIIQANQLQNHIQLRLQSSVKNTFKNIIQPHEFFHLSLCNPPFFSSLAEAKAESQRKWKQLGLKHASTHRNFGGQGRELACEGGEPGFLKSLVHESLLFGQQVGWFSSLVSKESSLPALRRDLEKARAQSIKVIDMAQGQKKSRLVAWSFTL